MKKIKLYLGFTLVILIGIIVYKTHLIHYLIICSAGKSNLEKNINTIRKFKTFPNSIFYYKIFLLNSDSSKIIVSNFEFDYNRDLLWYQDSVRILYSDSITPNYSLSKNKNLIENRKDSLIEFKYWEVRYLGKNNLIHKLSKFIGENLKTVISNLDLADCKYLRGKKNDLILAFDKSMYAKYGCLTGDWYNYQYHIGDKKKLDQRKVNYKEFENGIQYGWIIE